MQLFFTTDNFCGLRYVRAVGSTQALWFQMPGWLQEPHRLFKPFWGESSQRLCINDVVKPFIYTFLCVVLSLELISLTIFLKLQCFILINSHYVIAGSGEDCCIHEVTKIHEGSDKQQDGQIWKQIVNNSAFYALEKSWKMLINATAKLTSESWLGKKKSNFVLRLVDLMVFNYVVCHL